MRWLYDSRYGTAGYPEKVARRLRIVNVTAWIISGFAAVFAVWQFLTPRPGVWPVAAINALDAVLWSCLPLLHRFGPLAAGLTAVLTVFASHFAVILLIGTGAGMQMHYLAALAIAILFFGAERRRLTIALAALAWGFVVATQFLGTPDTGRLPPGSIAANFVVGSAMGIAIVYFIVHYAVRLADRAEAAAEREHARSERLLANILPAPVAARLKDAPEAAIADAYDDASILFADMAGFTARAADTAPADLVRFLNEAFTRFDRLVERHGLEKIKTTGDAYMVVSGVPERRADHAAALAAFALDLRAAAAGLTDPKGRPVPFRIGLAAGPVVAGVVGTRKFFYDVWGDAVNTAARMESTGLPGRIQVTDGFQARLAGRFRFEERGTIDVPGKGPMRTWWLEGRADGAAPTP
jgi:adenylate cyclase